MYPTLDSIKKWIEKNLIILVVSSSSIFATSFMVWKWYNEDGSKVWSLVTYGEELWGGLWKAIEFWEKVILVLNLYFVGELLSETHSSYLSKDYAKTVTVGWNIIHQIPDPNNPGQKLYRIEIPTEYSTEISDLIKDDKVLAAELTEAIKNDPIDTYEDPNIPNFMVFLDPITYLDKTVKPEKRSEEELFLMEKNQKDLVRRIRNLLSNILNNSQWPEYAHRHKNFNKNIYESPCFLLNYEKEKDINTIRTTRIWLIFHEELRIFLPKSLSGHCEEFICTQQEEQDIRSNFPGLCNEEMEKKKMNLVYDKIKKYFYVTDDVWCSRIINLQKWAMIEFDDSKAPYRRSYYVSLPFFRRSDQLLVFSWVIFNGNRTEIENNKRVLRRRKSSRMNSSSQKHNCLEEFFPFVILSETTCNICHPFSSNASLMDKVFSKIEMVQHQNPTSFIDSWIQLDDPRDQEAFLHKIKLVAHQSIKSSGWAQLARSQSLACEEILYTTFFDFEDGEIHVWLIYKDQLELCQTLLNGDTRFLFKSEKESRFAQHLQNWGSAEFDPPGDITPKFTIPNPSQLRDI